MKIFFLIISFSLCVMAQTETRRWEIAEQNYQITNIEIESENINGSKGLFSYIREFYAFTISDLDGDNCPFYPSCSAFFVRAAENAGLPKAALIFADRFTRDTNFLKALKKYPLYKNGKFFDPEYNYTLDDSQIIFLPINKIYSEP